MRSYVSGSATISMWYGEQSSAKTAMDFPQTVDGYGPSTKIPIVDPAFDGNVRLRFNLEIAFPGIGVIVVLDARSISMGCVS